MTSGILHAQKSVNQDLSQFELTKKLTEQIDNFELSRRASVVLQFLSTRYNLKKEKEGKDSIYPGQILIGEKTGYKKRTVIEAIKELNKKGLILSVKTTGRNNKYKLTPKFWTDLKNFDTDTAPVNSKNCTRGSAKNAPEQRSLTNNLININKKSLKQNVTSGSGKINNKSISKVSTDNIYYVKNDLNYGSGVKHPPNEIKCDNESISNISEINNKDITKECINYITQDEELSEMERIALFSEQEKTKLLQKKLNRTNISRFQLDNALKLLVMTDNEIQIYFRKSKNEKYFNHQEHVDLCYSNKMRKIRQEKIKEAAEPIKKETPLDMSRDQAIEFLNKLPTTLQKSYFAVELRKKWSL